MLPGLAVATYVYDIQLLGQINLVLLALLLLSMVALRSRRTVAAGMLLALAAAMKVFPLPALAYFIVRREWKATAVAVLALGLYVWFLPGVFRGFEPHSSHELNQWAGKMITDQSGQAP